MKKFIKDAAERAVKTFFQTLAGLLGAVMLFTEIEWLHCLSVAGMAALVSLLTSLSSIHLGEKGTACAVKLKEEN
jgi:hypothetical protein